MTLVATLRFDQPFVFLLKMTIANDDDNDDIGDCGEIDSDFDNDADSADADDDVDDDDAINAPLAVSLDSL